MMRRLIYTSLCLLFFLVQGKQMLATDELGAEIRYECVDPDSAHYLIEVTRYYACSAGINATPPVIAISSSCSQPVPRGSWQTAGMVDVTPICPGIATICNGGASPILDGVEALRYTRVYDFSGAGIGCDDYIISFYGCCRPSDLSSGAAGEGLYVTAGPLDPALCNSAPEFLFPPVIVLDTATEAHVALGANDPDGDSLAYDLVSCLDTFGTANTYLAGFSAANPLGTNWTVDIDSLTGNLNFIHSPGGSVKASLAVEMREYRAGVLIGTYVRDITAEAVPTIPAQPSANLPTLLPPDVDSVWGGTWLSDRVVSASIGEPVVFELDVFDQENDSTYVTWTQNIPGMEFYKDSDPTQVNTVSGRNPTIEVKFIPKSKGRKFFGIRLTDSAWCGIVNITDFGFGIDTRDTSFLATFMADTIYICHGDTLDLQPTILGKKATTPLAYTWITNASTDSVLRVFNPGSYTVEVKDTLGGDLTTRESEATVVVAYAPYCIWPGDTDNDGVANNFDVLAIGLGYSATGPTRADQGIDWSGKQGAPWGDTTALGGLDLVYADANGNGVIDVNDTLAISQNYSLSHLKGGGSNHGLPIFLFSQQSIVSTGDTLRIDVHLGLDTLPADSVYGVAFSVRYDNTLVDSASAHFVVDSSWLGDPVTDLFSMQKDLFVEGQIDIGISRNDHTHRTSYGQIARLDIIMIDDIIDKRAIKDTLVLRIENVRVINAQGEEIPVEISGELQIPVDDIVDALTPQLPEGSVRIFPNPTKNQINIDVRTTEAVDIYVYTLTGKQIMVFPQIKGRKQVNLNQLSAGMYILQARNSQGQIHKKIILSQ